MARVVRRASIIPAAVLISMGICESASAAEKEPRKAAKPPWGALERGRWLSSATPRNQNSTPTVERAPIAGEKPNIARDAMPESDAPTGTIRPQSGGVSGDRDTRQITASAEAALERGDIASARALFRYAGADPAAEHGLAMTWDPDVLSRLGVIGIEGDRARAEDLYKKAFEHGWRENAGDP